MEKGISILYKISVLLLITQASWSAPDWVESFQNEDAFYKYYFASSEVVTGDQEATKATYRFALEQAIEENFGVETKIQSSYVLSESEVESESQFDSKSRKVKIHGFEKIKQAKEDSTIYALYRYAKAEIQKEKNRLAKLPEQVSDHAELASEYSGNRYPTSLKVISEPMGAQVYIDGIRWGRTPISINGELSQGPHDLILEKDQFDPISKKVIVQEGDNRFFSKLFRAKATLDIKLTNFEGAAVFIDGNYIGKTPLAHQVIIKSKAYRIKISHPSIDTIIREIELESDQTKEIIESVDFKKSITRFLVFPKGTSVNINGEFFNGTQNSIEARLLPGDVLIKLEKEGYETLEIKNEVKPGKENYLGSFKLKRISPRKNAKQTHINEGFQDNSQKEGLEDEIRKVGRAIASLTSSPSGFYSLDFGGMSSSDSLYPLDKGSVTLGGNYGLSFINNKLNIYLGCDLEVFSEHEVNKFRNLRFYGISGFLGTFIKIKDGFAFGMETGKSSIKSESADGPGLGMGTPTPKYLIDRNFSDFYLSFYSNLRSDIIGINVGLKSVEDDAKYFSSSELTKPTKSIKGSDSFLFFKIFIRSEF